MIYKHLRLVEWNQFIPLAVDDEYWWRNIHQHLRIIHSFSEELGEEVTNDGCCSLLQRLEGWHEDHEAWLSILSDECSHAAAYWSAKQEYIFLVDSKYFIDEVIYCERILLQLNVVFFIIAEETVAWEFHC